MADATKKAAEAVKDAVSNVTAAVANTNIAGAAGEATSGKQLLDEETGEMVSKTERRFLTSPGRSRSFQLHTQGSQV